MNCIYSMYHYDICAINTRDLFKITSYHYGVNATLHHQGGAQGGKKGLWCIRLRLVTTYDIRIHVVRQGHVTHCNWHYLDSTINSFGLCSCLITHVARQVFLEYHQEARTSSNYKAGKIKGVCHGL